MPCVSAPTTRLCSSRRETLSRVNGSCLCWRAATPAGGPRRPVRRGHCISRAGPTLREQDHSRRSIGSLVRHQTPRTPYASVGTRHRHEGGTYERVERETRSVLLVVSDDALLTHSFWTFFFRTATTSTNLACRHNGAVGGPPTYASEATSHQIERRRLRRYTATVVGVFSDVEFSRMLTQAPLRSSPMRQGHTVRFAILSQCQGRGRS